MNKNSNGKIILIALVLSVFAFFPITNVRALTISYPTLEIYTNQDESFSDVEFYFQIGNNGIANTTVTPNVEVMFLDNWEDYYTITFDRGNKTLQSGESARWYPTIYNNVSLGYTYQIHFTFEGRTDISGNVIVAGVGATVAHHVTSENDGHRLIINSVDQADRQVTSFIRLYYGGDDTKGQGWSIIKSFNGTRFDDVVLQGWYKILAIESTINDQKQIDFYLETDTTKNVVFELLAFTSMQIFIPKVSTYLGNISYTLSNNYQLLTNVYIHFYVKVMEKDALVFNSTAIKPHLDKGIYTDTLIINTKWFSDTYLFVGEVYVNGKLFLHQNSTIDLWFSDNPYAFGEQSQQDEEFIFISVFSLISLMLIGLAFFRHELVNKYRSYKTKKQ